MWLQHTSFICGCLLLFAISLNLDVRVGIFPWIRKCDRGFWPPNYRVFWVLTIFTTTKRWDTFFQFCWTSKLSKQSLKDGPNSGFFHSLRKLSMKSSLACCVLEPVLKVGWNFWDLFWATSQTLKRKFRSKIGYVHGTQHYPKSRIGLSKTK